MKKVLAVCFALVMMVGLCLSSIAAPGGFIASPSGNQAPVLVGSENEAEDCESEIIITSYADRDDLPEDVRRLIEEAYTIIRENEDLSELNEELAEFAAHINANITDLAVSDLFNIGITDCDTHDLHGHFDVTLKPEVLSNFVALLTYVDGKWEVVESAVVTNNGEHLEFDVEKAGPFAIVVNTNNMNIGDGDDGDASQTGDITYALMGVMAVCAATAIVLWRKSKKHEA